MRQGLSLRAVGHATSIFLATTFVLCVGFDLLFPAHAMYQAWQHLLPGFEWISWKSFFLGAIESYGYGWYVGLIWVPLTTCLQRGASSRATASDSAVLDLM